MSTGVAPGVKIYRHAARQIHFYGFLEIRQSRTDAVEDFTDSLAQLRISFIRFKSKILFFS
jgi:hypothetical protein